MIAPAQTEIPDPESKSSPAVEMCPALEEAAPPPCAALTDPVLYRRTPRDTKGLTVMRICRNAHHRLVRGAVDLPIVSLLRPPSVSHPLPSIQDLAGGVEGEALIILPSSLLFHLGAHLLLPEGDHHPLRVQQVILRLLCLRHLRHHHHLLLHHLLLPWESIEALVWGCKTTLTKSPWACRTPTSTTTSEVEICPTLLELGVRVRCLFIKPRLMPP